MQTNQAGEVVWPDLPMGDSRFRVYVSGFVSRALTVTTRNRHQMKLRTQLEIGFTGMFNPLAEEIVVHGEGLLEPGQMPDAQALDLLRNRLQRGRYPNPSSAGGGKSSASAITLTKFADVLFGVGKIGPILPQPYGGKQSFGSCRVSSGILAIQVIGSHDSRV